MSVFAEKMSAQQCTQGSYLKQLQIKLLISICMLVLHGCASLPSAVDRDPTYFISATHDTRLGEDVEKLVSTHPGYSGFYVLTEGIDAFAARLELINDAEKTIDMQYYIWHDDLTGKVLHHQLLKAADRGVRVRLLLDDLDTAGKDQLLHTLDSHPNIEIHLFNPFANRSLRAADFIVDTKRVNHRMHNKTLTVDNQVTIFGGRNIGDEYFDASEEVGFSDLDALAVGPVVTEISQIFDLYWNSQWTLPMSAFKDSTAGEVDTLTEFRAESDAFFEKAKEIEYAAAIAALDIVKFKSFSELDLQWSDWKFIYDLPDKVESKEITSETHLSPKLKQAMDQVEGELLIVSPYFVPGKKFTRYLTDTVKRGVHVKILTNSLAANDVAMVHSGYMRYRKDLVAGGVELYEFKPLKRAGESGKQGEAKKSESHGFGSSRASLHGKYYCFDKQWIFVGSFNLDGRSVALNTEQGVFIQSTRYAELMSRSFEERVMDKAYRVMLTGSGDLEWLTLDEGKQVRYDKEPETGFWQRFGARFLSIFVPESQL